MNQLFKQLTGPIATLTLLTVVVACSSSKSTQDTSPATDTSSESSFNNSSEEKIVKPSAQQLSKAHNLGEVVSIKDKNLNLQITVNSTRQHQGKGVIKPNQGKKWIVVDTTIANQGQNPKTLAIGSFELIDRENNLYEVALLAEALEDVASPTGQIKPGDKQRGQVAFEVPRGEKGLKLIFKPNRSECEASDSKPKTAETLNCELVVVKLE